MGDKIMKMMSAIFAGRLQHAIELCNEIHDELVIRYHKQLSEEE